MMLSEGRASRSTTRAPRDVVTAGATASPDPASPRRDLPSPGALGASARNSSSCYGRGAPPEAGAVDPHPMQDHRQLAGERHPGLLHPRAARHAQRPGLEARKAHRAGEHDVGGLVEDRTRHGVTDLADPPAVVDLARLVLARHQAEM